MEKIWRRVQKIKAKFSKGPAPLPSNAVVIETQTTGEISNIFGEEFTSILTMENYTYDFSRHKRSQETERTKFPSNNDEPHNTPFSQEEFHHPLITNNPSHG